MRREGGIDRGSEWVSEGGRWEGKREVGREAGEKQMITSSTELKTDKMMCEKSTRT